MCEGIDALRPDMSGVKVSALHTWASQGSVIIGLSSSRASSKVISCLSLLSVTWFWIHPFHIADIGSGYYNSL